MRLFNEAVNGLTSRLSCPTIAKMGITPVYDPDTPLEITYEMPIDKSQLTSPRDSQRYFENMIRAVAKDLRTKKGKVLIKTYSRYQEALKSTTEDFVQRGRGQQRKFDLIEGALVYTPAILLGVTGIVFGYAKSSELATHAANAMNHYSTHLALATGILQAGITLAGTAIVGGANAITGAFVGKLAAKPTKEILTPHTMKVREYNAIAEALHRAEPLPETTDIMETPKPSEEIVPASLEQTVSQSLQS